MNVKFLKVLGPLVLAGLVAIAFGVLPASGQGSGYRFSNFEIRGQKGGVIEVTYDYSWAGSEFPGTHTCKWTVRDQNGQVMAEKIQELTGLKTDYSTKVAEIPVHDFAGQSRPRSADASCDSVRLDDPNGEYVISDVHVARAPASDGGEGITLLRFDADWTSDGEFPGTQDCTASVYGPDDSHLFDYDFSLTAPDLDDFEFRMFPGQDYAGDPERADVACRSHS